jgi:hypothetical protein
MQTLILKNSKKKNYLELTLRCLLMLKKSYLFTLWKYNLLQQSIPTKSLHCGVLIMRRKISAPSPKEGGFGTICDPGI